MSARDLALYRQYRQAAEAESRRHGETERYLDLTSQANAAWRRLTWAEQLRADLGRQ